PPHLDSQSPHAFPADVARPPLLFGVLGPTDVPTPALAVILLGGLAFLLRRRAAEPGVRTGWAHAALWAAVGLYIALPPRVMLHGWSLRLPQWWLPITRYWRPIERLGTAGLMGLSLLTGLAFTECARLVSRPAVPARLRPLARSALAAPLAGGVPRAHGARTAASRRRRAGDAARRDGSGADPRARGLGRAEARRLARAGGPRRARGRAPPRARRLRSPVHRRALVSRTRSPSPNSGAGH